MSAGKPWIAYVLSAIAFLNIVVGVYLSATIFWDPELGQSRLPIEALVAAGGFIAVSSAAYGLGASHVKAKELAVQEATLTYVTDDEE